MCRNCKTGGEEELNTKALRVIRALKPLKIARILRSIKFLRVLKLVSTVLEYLRIPPFVDRIFKVLVAILLLVHACACCYWLVKESSNLPEEVDHWLISVGVPDGLDSTLYEKYVTSFYFVNTVFCTVGFGDISAENSQERLFCVLLFYMGTLVFGMLLAEVQDALNKTRQMVRERENTVQVMVNFCRKAQVPLHLEKKVVNWIEFTMEHHQDRTNQEELLKTLPPNLHRQMMGHLHQGTLLHTMPFFRVEHEQRENLCLDLWSVMKPALFGPFVPIAASGKAADRMYVIVAGTVILQEDGNFRSTLHPGETFGEYALFGQRDWGWQRTQGAAQFASITNVMCLYLTADRFNDVLDAYPADLREELEAVVAQVAAASEIEAKLGFLNPGDADAHLTRWYEISKRLLRHHRMSGGKSDFNQNMLGRAVIKMGNKNGGIVPKRGVGPRANLNALVSFGSRRKMLAKSDSTRVDSLQGRGNTEIEIEEADAASSATFEESVRDVMALASGGENEDDEDDDGRRRFSIGNADHGEKNKEGMARNGGNAANGGAHHEASSGVLASMEAMRAEWQERACAMERRMEALAGEVASANRSTRSDIAALTKAVSALVDRFPATNGKDCSEKRARAAGVRSEAQFEPADVGLFDGLGLQLVDSESHPGV